VNIERVRINYDDYRRLIAERAWYWAERTGWDFAELMAEGNLVFVLALREWKRERSRFSTFLYIRLNGRFGNLTKGLWRGEIADVDPDQISSSDGNPEHVEALKEMIRHLSKDARTLVECILETPRDLMWMVGHHGKGVKITKRKLEKYFVQKKGWSHPRCWQASSEIRLALNTL